MFVQLRIVNIWVPKSTIVTDEINKTLEWLYAIVLYDYMTVTDIETMTQTLVHIVGSEEICFIQVSSWKTTTTNRNDSVDIFSKFLS